MRIEVIGALRLCVTVETKSDRNSASRAWIRIALAVIRKPTPSASTAPLVNSAMRRALRNAACRPGSDLMPTSIVKWERCGVFGGPGGDSSGSANNSGNCRLFSEPATGVPPIADEVLPVFITHLNGELVRHPGNLCDLTGQLRQVVLSDPRQVDGKPERAVERSPDFILVQQAGDHLIGVPGDRGLEDGRSRSASGFELDPRDELRRKRRTLQDLHRKGRNLRAAASPSRAGAPRG